MRKVKIAQIGTSTYSHGNMVFGSLKKQSDIFEIAGYAFPENERVKYPERMADFEGYPELTVEQILRDPTIEAVTVETEEKPLALLDAKKLIVACGEGALLITEVQPEGGKRMNAEDFLRGKRLEKGKIFG